MLAEVFLSEQLTGMRYGYFDSIEVANTPFSKVEAKLGVQNAELVSALHSHCRGQRFESAMLHHITTLILILDRGCRFFGAYRTDDTK